MAIYVTLFHKLSNASCQPRQPHGFLWPGDVLHCGLLSMVDVFSSISMHMHAGIRIRSYLLQVFLLSKTSMAGDSLGLLSCTLASNYEHSLTLIGFSLLLEFAPWHSQCRFHTPLPSCHSQYCFLVHVAFMTGFIGCQSPGYVHHWSVFSIWMSLH